jgi:hypothetical protein
MGRGKKLGLWTNTKKENVINKNTRVFFAAGWGRVAGFH